MKRIFTSRVVTTAHARGAVVFVVGAAAYIASRPDPSPATNTETYGRDYELADTEPTYKAADLPKGVQTIAGRVHPRGRRARGSREGLEAHPSRAAGAVRLHLQAVADGRHPRPVLPLEGHQDRGFEIDGDHAERRSSSACSSCPRSSVDGQAAGVRHRPQGVGHRREEDLAA